MANSVPIRPSRYKVIDVYDHEHMLVDVNVIVAALGGQPALLTNPGILKFEAQRLIKTA